MFARIRQGLQLSAIFNLVLLLLYSLVACRDLASAGRHLNQCPDSSFASLSPKTLGSPIIDLVWVDTDDKVVFAITRRVSSSVGVVWRSKDGGSTFEDLTSRFSATIKGSEPVEIIQIFYQKSSPSNVLFMGSGTNFWLSNDYGETLKPRPTPTKWKGSQVRSYKLHPTNDDWILLLAKRPDCTSFDYLQQACPYDLMLSKDMFSSLTWQNLTANANGKIAGFVDFDWMANLHGAEDMNIPSEGILATEYELAGSYDMPWDPDVNFAASTDYFKSYQTRVKCGNQFELVGGAVYLAFANSCPYDINGSPRQGPISFPQGITLYTSIDGGKSFNQACLPVALKQEGYELMQTHDGKSAVIIVDFKIANGNSDIPASSVYTAGPHHALFSMSMTNVFHSDFGYSADFSYLDGLPGIFIANQLLPRTANDDPGQAGGRRLLQEDPFDYYEWYYANPDYYDFGGLSDTPIVESRISYDGGARWNRIKAPTEFKNPQCDRCNGDQECYLHLYGMSDWESSLGGFPAVYSNPSAPGLVMATGNVGPKGTGLGDNDALCTFLSKDGGVTWTDVGVGAYIYEFADWGGVIVMAQYPGLGSTPADKVMFSMDYGRCWQSVPLSEALLVDNIRIEPDGQRPRVLLHGRACRKSLHEKCRYDSSDKRLDEGLVFAIDIAELLFGKRDAQCGPADYEQWTIPTDKNQTRCVLGQQMQFTRRKQDSLCLNGAAYQRPLPVNTTCRCTLDDVECDYGWVRNGTKCEKLPSTSLGVCPVVQQNKYSVSSSGKRLVHGDKCSNVSAVIADTDGKGASTLPDSPNDSPPSKGHSGLFKFFMFLLVLLLLGGAFTAWWIFMATTDQKDAVIGIVSMVISFVVSAWEWLLSKCVPSPRRTFADQDLGYFQPLGDASHPGAADVFTLK